jgi:hypothetical protein
MIGTRPHPERISCGVPAESDPIEPPREGETPGSARESGGFANDKITRRSRARTATAQLITVDKC